MANIKSAKKRILVSNKKAERNKAIRSEVKTAIKSVEQAVSEGDKTAAQEKLAKTISVIEKAGSKGVYHKNNVSRKVARLSRAVSSME
ncbi:MAG: 30S ribosomal protein S20 [Bilifractor sp.]